MNLDAVVKTVAAATHLLPTPDPRFGIAVATVDGDVHCAGDWRQPFAVQSIAKVFALAHVLAWEGDSVAQGSGRRPSKGRRDSGPQHGLEGPANPVLHGSGLVITDRLLEVTGGQACHTVLDFIRTEAGNSAITMDAEIAQTEIESGNRNLAIAHLIAAYRNLRMPVQTVLAHYTWQCAIAASCRDIALAGLFLARGGVRVDGRNLLSLQNTQRINATLLTCGAYDASAELAHRIGLPLKTGVGGGILAVAPKQGTVCVWGPGLDACGTSVAGQRALEHFAMLTGWSVF